MGSPKLTVVVPATDRPDTLARCCAAIEAAADGPDEVIVVEVPPHAGPAAARNAGALPATGDVLVFVDADVAVRPDAFARIRSAFEEDPGLAAVFGSYDDSPDVRGTVGHFRNLLHHHVHQSAAGEATTFWAGLGAIRRRDFEALGGFDAEEYELSSMEDIELGMRLSDSGARIRLDPGLTCTHLKDWSLAAMVRSDLTRRGAPWVALLLRRRRGSTALNLAWRHRLTALAVTTGSAALGLRRPRVAAAMLAFQVAANRDLYRLLLERRGPREALAGVGLHAVHHLSAVCAVPVGVAAHLRRRGRRGVPIAAEPTRESRRVDARAAALK